MISTYVCRQFNYCTYFRVYIRNKEGCHAHSCGYTLRERSATTVKLNVKKLEIFSKSTVKPLYYFFDVYSQIGQGSSIISAI